MQAQKVLATLLLRLLDRGSDSQQAGKRHGKCAASASRQNAKMECRQNGKQAEWKALMQD
jgi:hypothetical protein